MFVLRKYPEKVFLCNVCVVFGLNMCLKIANAEFLREDLHHKGDFSLVQEDLRLTSAILRANSVISFKTVRFRTSLLSPVCK